MSCTDKSSVLRPTLGLREILYHALHIKIHMRESTENSKTFRDYITEYHYRVKNDKIHCFATVFGLNKEKLRNMMSLNLTQTNINKFNRLDELKKTLTKTKQRPFLKVMSRQN